MIIIMINNKTSVGLSDDKIYFKLSDNMVVTVSLMIFNYLFVPCTVCRRQDKILTLKQKRIDLFS